MKIPGSRLILLAAIAVACIVSVAHPPSWPVSVGLPVVSTDGPPGHAHAPCPADMTDDESYLSEPVAPRRLETASRELSPAPNRSVVAIPASSLVLRL